MTILGLDRAAVARYVASRRVPTGGYCFYRTPSWGVEEPNAPDTYAALRCLRLLGEAVPDKAQVASWLASLQGVDGAYPTLTIGWAAIQALGELGAQPDQSSADWLSAWSARVLDAPARDQPDWPGVLTTALRLVGLLHQHDLEVPTDSVAALLRRSRDPDGGWAAPGADLETSATALLLAEHVGSATQLAEPLSRLLRACGDPVLGFRPAPRSRGVFTGALWGGLVLVNHLHLEPAYPAAIGANLRGAQRVDGGVGRRAGAISTLADTLAGLEADLLLAKVLGR